MGGRSRVRGTKGRGSRGSGLGRTRRAKPKEEWRMETTGKNREEPKRNGGKAERKGTNWGNQSSEEGKRRGGKIEKMENGADRNGPEHTRSG